MIILERGSAIGPLTRIAPKQMSRNALLAAAMILLSVTDNAAASSSSLTIEVAGDLLEHGGIVVVYPIPVSAEAWPTTIGNKVSTDIRLDGRYTEVQLRYPESGTYTYRFRPVDGTPHASVHATQVLTIIGTSGGQGPQMAAGFENAFSAGGQIVRVPPIEELAGQDNATRTAARWGETMRHDAVPPADQRSARALASIIQYAPKPIPLQCKGGELVQVCTIPGDQWPALEARWWRAIAEQRLERLKYHALRPCWDSTRFGGGTCEPDPESDEPAYLPRK